MNTTPEKSAATIDKNELEQKVKDMYREVALNPKGEFHFEMGRDLAESLGYSPEDLDRIPAESIESFAGVGYYFHLANITQGESVIDFGSGAGMDTFIAALKVGNNGRVIGIDMTDEQLSKAKRLRDKAGFSQVSYLEGYLERVPSEDESFDLVISNGVINLAPDKVKVFKEMARVLKPGGRIALSDIVTEIQLSEGITCNTNLWAACIGGAMQVDNYRTAIEKSGMRVEKVEDNSQYQFISKNAQGASKEYGVKSISLLAVKQ
ncbi:MAG: methyltransferase domain-containing protein [Bacteroidetes bacterium]|nr:methyltransferase domain-containing protein [Bacteroidota bacterium]